MRAVILLVVFALEDIAKGLGNPYLSADSHKFFIGMFIILFVMDIVDFFRGRE